MWVATKDQRLAIYDPAVGDSDSGIEPGTAFEDIPELEEHIKMLLVPADPEDSKNAVMEIRGGT
ncbi:PCRF domain-containing protein, partial [Bacteroides sp. 214]|nr:PCRF domain-containing protein [Bacteroides sp. 214]